MVKACTVQYSNLILGNNFLHRKKIMKKCQRNMKSGNQWKKVAHITPNLNVRSSKMNSSCEWKNAVVAFPNETLKILVTSEF